MDVTREQLSKYIHIQKKVRGIELTEEEAKKEIPSLLLFVTTVFNVMYEREKQTQIDIKIKEK